jgi:hypothetical protein
MKMVSLMPVHRPANWLRVRSNFETCRAHNPGVDLRWHPLMYGDEWDAVPAAAKELLTAEWIQPLLVGRPNRAGWPRAQTIYTLFNAGMAELAAAGYDGWMILGSDDDLLPYAYAGRVAAAAASGAQALMVSLARGQRAVHSAYPTWGLQAAPENLAPCAVNGSQVAVAFPAVAGDRFEFAEIADGVMLQKWYQRMPSAFRFAPEFQMPFNALEPERWDANKLQALLNQP